MRLDELFDDPPLEIVNNLRDRVMDVLTPFAASDIPYVTVNQIIDKLHDARTGVLINRALIMHVLDPNEVKLVKKIEGDRIYLTKPTSDENAHTEDDEEKAEDKIKKTAQKQAKKDIEKPAPKMAGKGPLG